MPKITYIDKNNTAHEVEVPVGNTVMQGAIDNMIEGIVAECGGALACATCHCMVDEKWVDATGACSDEEDMMLDLVAERNERSRLSCQITVTDELDGLVVHLPETQGF